MYYRKNCPVCSATAFTDVLTCQDHTVSHKSFTIQSCDGCGFKFTNPVPDLDHLGDYYQSEDYISHSNTQKGIVAKLYHVVRNYTLRKKRRLIEGYVSRGTILDYGSGTGMFLKHVSDHGWKIRGVEPDAGARKVAQEQGVELSSSLSSLDLGPESVDAITLWHVLEHIADLDEALRFFQKALKRDGVLVIAVPNHRSLDAQQYGAHWAAYDVPRHLYHFDRTSMQRLLQGAGFQLQDVRPMLFDSFYVSLLSEKYKRGKPSLVRAFLNGLRSNLKASSTREYSSLIYIFRKSTMG